MDTPPQPVPSEETDRPLAEGCPKRPWHSKKWTYAMWVTTLMCGLFVYYIEAIDEVKDLVLYTILGLTGALAVLTLGGIAALDRYRMGLVQVVSAVRGQEVPEAEPAPITAGTTTSPLDEPEDLPSSAIISIEDPEDTEDPDTSSN